MSDDMNQDGLDALRQIEVPSTNAAARQRAMAAAMQAFEAAKTEDTKYSAASPQGVGLGQRLKSIVSLMKGQWIMDMRIPVGTAALALLLLPLGYQLYSTTMMTAPVAVSKQAAPAAVEKPAPAPPAADAETAVVSPIPAGVDETQPPARAATNAPVQLQQEAAVPPPPVMAEPTPAPMADMAVQSGQAMAAPKMTAQQNQSAPMEMRQAPLGGIAPLENFAPAPSPMSSSAATMPSGDTFSHFEESPVKTVAEAPVSTFSIDVDTASYSYVRRQLEEGYVPEPDAVRLEELINYFPYDYPTPADASTPFKASMGVIPTPWNPKTQLLEIGIKGYVPPATAHKPNNLVFLIDTSGSMDEPDKLPLLKRAFSLLVDQLGADDTVSIVVYAGSAGVALEPTKASDKVKISSALDNLEAGGGTAGAEGIELAYQLAEQHKLSDGNNRVILATDGDFNIGIDDPDQLKTFIKAKRQSGISLSVLGFGEGNLDDATMQALAQNGNGNASYISSFKEAQKVLVAEGGSTLTSIAQDVKIQVEFNPALVSEYRLVGYETRALNREDFNNDAVDAGDIGAGHTVTAIYEITPKGSGAELVDPLRYGTAAPAAAVPAGGEEIAFLKMRYKLPGDTASKLIEQSVTPDMVRADIAAGTDDQRFAAAVAAFGQKLKGSNYGNMDWSAIKALALGARGADESGYRSEFVQLLDTAALLKPDAK